MDLTKSRKRLPPKQDLFLVFSVSVFFTHLWGYATFFYNVPALILRSTIGELAALSGYNLVAFFADSIFFTVILIFFYVILPTSRFRNHFVLTASITIIISTIFAIFTNVFTPYFPYLFYTRIKETYLDLQISETMIQFGALCIILFLWVASVLRLPNFFYNKNRLTKIILGFAERTTPLSVIFLVLDIVSVFGIALRNIF